MLEPLETLFEQVKEFKDSEVFKKLEEPYRSARELQVEIEEFKRDYIERIDQIVETTQNDVILFNQQIQDYEGVK